MDPQATLFLIDQAISDLQYDRAIMAIGDYYDWRLKGGYEPPDCTPASELRGDAWCARLVVKLADRVAE